MKQDLKQNNSLSLDPNDITSRRPRNLNEIFEQMSLGVPSYVANGDFLDEFYHAKPEERQSFLDDEPIVPDGLSISEEALARMAATAEKLAHDFKLIVPEWVFKKKYYMTEASFMDKPLLNYKPEFVIEIIKDAPKEFANRNVYVSGNALTRM